jgi:hypothetical protein
VRELTEVAVVFFVVGWAKAANGAKQRPGESSNQSSIFKRPLSMKS